MTNEEALLWCDDFRNNILRTGSVKPKYMLALGAMQAAMTAIAKQIPQKVKNGACPYCGRIFLYRHGERRLGNCCDNCGQALDWGY